jgi:hypothetical protein
VSRLAPSWLRLRTSSGSAGRVETAALSQEEPRAPRPNGWSAAASDDQRQRGEEPDHAEPRYRLEARLSGIGRFTRQPQAAGEVSAGPHPARLQAGESASESAGSSASVRTSARALGSGFVAWCIASWMDVGCALTALALGFLCREEAVGVCGTERPTGPVLTRPRWPLPGRSDQSLDDDQVEAGSAAICGSAVSVRRTQVVEDFTEVPERE